MYIVTRTFRDAKGIFKVGTQVEPTDVRAFKSRLADKHIINVDTCDQAFWSNYLMNKYGIELHADLPAISSSNDAEAANGPTEVLTTEDTVGISEEPFEETATSLDSW